MNPTSRPLATASTRRRWIALCAAAVLVTGCSRKSDVVGGYTLVTQESLNPDGHPGTALLRGGKTVWSNVYVGYFHDNGASHFLHNGIFVFVAPLPMNGGTHVGPQLFAVRGDGPPVLLTERLHGQRLVIPKRLSDESNTFQVESIATTDGGVRLELGYWKDRNTAARRTIDATWETIEQLLGDAASSGEVVHAPLGSYYVLPLK